MRWTTSTSDSSHEGTCPLIKPRTSLVGGWLFFLLLQPISLYAFDIQDFITMQLAPSQTATLTGKLAARHLLPKVVGNSNDLAIKLGFAGIGDFAPPQLHDLDVDTPFPVFRISLERLRNWNWQLQSPIWLLLEEANFLQWSVPTPAWFLFPITLGGHVKSSVSIAMAATDQTWKIRQIGSSEKILQLASHTAPHLPGPSPSPPSAFVVEIPALDTYYLGIIQGTDFKIKHAVTDPLHSLNMLSFGIPAGTVESAVDVFKRLQPEASKVFNNQVPR